MSARRSTVTIPEFIPAGAIKVDEYRHNRNFIRIGDIVTCRPKVGGPFRAKVLRILVEAEDPTNVREVDVIGGYKDEKAFRTFRPDNITRLAQSRLDKGDEDEPARPTPARRQPRAEGAAPQADARTCARHPKRRRKGCCLDPVA